MTDCRLYPSPLQGALKAIASKSVIHRALICAALAPGKTTLRLRGFSLDMAVTAQAMRTLGAYINEQQQEDLWILNVEGIQKKPDQAVIHLGESGSSLRFILPLAAALGISTLFTGSGRLPERPIAPLIEALQEQGVHFSSDTLPFRITNAWTGGELTLPGHISSQFISGVLMAAPVTARGLNLTVTSPLVSKNYIAITRQVMADFGVTSLDTPNGFRVSAASYQSPSAPYMIAGDWSNAAFFLVAGALGGPITIYGLHANDSQGDKIIVDILQRFGAHVIQSENAVQVSAGKRQPLHEHLQDYPDLLPILTILAAAAPGESIFTGVGRLKDKESDRLASSLAMLKALGVPSMIKDDTFHVYGVPLLHGGIVDTAGDHRIAMSAAIAATCLCMTPVQLKNSNAVHKSYPSFYTDLQALGGHYELILR